MLGFGTLAKRMFGSANDRRVKSLQSYVDSINALEGDWERLSDQELRARTDHFRARLKEGETLDDLLVEAFATVREAAKRTLGQRHYDVQLMGGVVLHQGRIAEMKTGEGKTLVSTLAVYLNAIEGKGAHVVTVNDYLAQRDAEWMGQIYKFLGLTVGCIVQGLSEEERRAAYAADVTYGTNNELGFDYLRDNMKFELETMVQRPFNFAIVDEVDSILIDEARTPLIISGPTEDNSELYITVDRLMAKLTEDHYEKDEKSKHVTLTEEGTEHIEQLLDAAGLLKPGGLYAIENVSVVHHVNQALRAHQMFKPDVDYIVKDDKVVIIDEFTGRMMEGRRYSDGLHQALEARENVAIQNENQTLASITFQNYFRLYPKLAGMTGTAATEAAEFGDIYKLEVVEMPTNLPVVREDLDDEVYRTANEKYSAILDLIEERHEAGQPLLVGTVSIEKSEHLSRLLKKRKIRHNVLNARHHEKEAFIISQAGRSGAVTIATNMAGRGTDIQLGGNLEMRIAQETAGLEDEKKRAIEIRKIKADIEADKKQVLEAGGLYVIATERHESRRIDNQLRGRSGRQGDPGGTKFFLSLEDDLMRIFGSDRMDAMLVKLGLQEGEAIVHTWINKALEKAQQKVEARNFEARKNILKFDDVMNDQRKVIYEQRIELMRTDDVSDTIADMRHDIIHEMVARHIPEKVYPEQWDSHGLEIELNRVFGIKLPVSEWAKEEGIADEEITSRVIDSTDRMMAERAANFGHELARWLEKSILLNKLDQLWKDHLLQLDHLKQIVGLRAFGQRDPLNEYKTEAFSMFADMLTRVREETTSLLAHVQIRDDAQQTAALNQPARATQEHHLDPVTGESTAATPQFDGTARSRQQAAQINPADPSTWGRVPRNATCPCDSGKKYKHCHGRIA
ncbi:MAG: preprotein translocase subunit SecA [Sphingomonadales bacterium]